MAAEPVVPKKNKRLSGIERRKIASGSTRIRILDYIARNQYRGLNRRDIIDGVADGKKGTVRGSIAKTLGRLVHDNYLEETVTIVDNPPSKREGQGLRRHRGYVGVSLDPATIRAEAEKAKAQGKVDENHESKPISQEEVVAKIAAETPKWKEVIQNAGRGTGATEQIGQAAYWPHEIVLLDIAITHGAGRDLLIGVSYQNQVEFMRYVRKFIQMMPHVTNTQTEEIAVRAAEVEEMNGKEAE